MIKKRLFALAMTAVMVLSTSVMAFADDATTKATDAAGNTGTVDGDKTTWNISSTLTTSIEATGEMQQASIKVTVPTTTQFVINPYKLTVETYPEDNGTFTASDKNLQVISPEYTVTNMGEVDLTVDATISGSVTGGLALATASVASTSTKKEVFLYVNFKRAIPTVGDDNNAVFSNTTEFDKDGIVKVESHEAGGTYYAVDKSQITLKENEPDVYVLTDDALADFTAGYNYTVSSKSATASEGSVKVTYTLVTYKILGEGDYDKNAAQGAVTSKDTTYKSVGKITAADGSGAATTGGKLTFTIDGSTAVNPTTNWTGSETATVNIKFSFTPSVE
jgi:hypothetical protein